MRYATASPTNCSEFRTLPPGSLVMGTRRCDHISPVLHQLHWLLVLQRVMFKIATLIHQSLSGNAPGTWPTAVSSSPTPMSDNYVLPTLEHSLSVGRAAVLETGPLPLQDHTSGTVCRPISDYVDCHKASSGSYCRHFYSDSEATAQCELFLTVPNRNILTYLLTYISHID